MTESPLAVIWDPKFREYDFGPGHPFDETSRDFAVRLLESTLDPAQRDRFDWHRSVEPAPLPLLRSFHKGKFLDFVREASTAGDRRLLDAHDTPSFPGCYEATARIVAGTELAVRLVQERGGAAFAPAGGLHHAQPDQASGFCIFNDVAIAIGSARRAGHRVAYIDIDAHHGDGVMYGFYRDGRVLDIDFHQDGRTLFPGTGSVSETGEGDGVGLKVNIPLPPHTGDEALVPLARRIVVPLVREFRPDLFVIQHGADGHWGDPLARLQYTPAGYAAVDRLFTDLAKEFGGRIVVTGGGGYEPASVARTLARAAWPLAGLPTPSDEAALPETWKAEFGEAFGPPLPARWVDPPELERSLWGQASEERLVRSLEEALGRTFPAP